MTKLRKQDEEAVLSWLQFIIDRVSSAKDAFLRGDDAKALIELSYATKYTYLVEEIIDDPEGKFI